MFQKAKNWILQHKEIIFFWGGIALLLISFFFSGYFVGKSENRIPIIIEKYSEKIDK